jgi:phosphocarrier protein HPr
MTGFAQPTPHAEAVVQVLHPVGLHARPSVLFTKLAMQFDCAVEVAKRPRGHWVDAKSIVRVMGLKVPFGALIALRASGPGAPQAVAALCALVESGLRETDLAEAASDGAL